MSPRRPSWPTPVRSQTPDRRLRREFADTPTSGVADEEGEADVEDDGYGSVEEEEEGEEEEQRGVE